jgi:hypothetical protein
MSGNILSKGIDLLGTANYAAAGAADALLSGDNPIEGAGRGIQERASFVDTLRHHGAPGVVALPAGLLADILVPAVPGIGLATKGVKAARYARLTGVLERSLGEERSLAKILVSHTGDISDVAYDASRMQDAAHAGEAAGDMFHARAATTERLRPQDMDPETTAKLIESADTGPQNPFFAAITGTTWAKNLGHVKSGLLDPLEKLMDQPIFKGVGKAWVKLADTMQPMNRALEGELLARVEDIAAMVPKADHKAFWLATHGESLADDMAHLQEPLAKWRRMTEEVYDLHAGLGTRQKMGMHTWYLQNRLTPAEKAAAKDLHTRLVAGVTEHGGSGMSPITIGHGAQRLDRWVPTALRDETRGSNVGRFVWKLAQDGAEFDAKSGEIVALLKHTKNYGMKVAKDRVVKQHVERGLPDVMSYIHEMHPNVPMAEVRAEAEAILANDLLRTGDISKQLQHQRITSTLPDPDEYHVDPRVWGAKFARDNANLVARTKVFGPGDQVFDGLVHQYKVLNGVEHAAEIAMEGEVKRGYDTLLKSQAVLTNRLDDPTSPALRAISTISDYLFLGPKTLLLQATTLANHAGLAGIGNSLAGVGITLADPRWQKFSRRIGVAVPNMLDALGTGTAKFRRWNFVLKAVGHADAQMRMFGAVAGGLHAVELEEQVLKLVRAGKLEEAKGVVAYMGRRLKVDASVLLEGKALPDALLMRTMQNVADVTNFTGDVARMPKVLQGNAGKYFMKFKAFSLQQSQFMGGLLEEGRQHGNWKPLLRYAAMFPWVYKDVLKVTNQFRSSERQLDPHEDPLEYLKNLLMIGALGYWGDAGMALGSDSEALGLGLVAGPNTGALLKTKQGAKDLLPWRFDPVKAARSLQPQSINQMRSLWENSQ